MDVLSYKQREARLYEFESWIDINIGRSVVVGAFVGEGKVGSYCF